MKNEISIRASFFLAVFVLVAAWELLAPRRSLTTSKTVRWVSNLSMAFVNPLVLYFVFPVLALEMALKAHKSSWGLLNILGLPPLACTGHRGGRA